MCCIVWLFYFGDAAPTDIYTLSLHDALPIWPRCVSSWPHLNVPVEGPALRAVEAVRRLAPLVRARDVRLLEVLEVRDAGHHVVALGRVTDLRLLEPPLRLLLVTHQLLHRVPHGVGRGVRGEERDEDEPVAELAELLERERVRVRVPTERGGVVEREREVGVSLSQRAGEGDRRLARGIRQLAPDQVHAGVGVRPSPPDRLLQAPTHGALGVRPRDDDEVRVETVPRVHGGAVLAERLLQAHHGLAGDVPAALREPLVLDVDAGDTRPDVLLHRPDRREPVPAAVVRSGA